MADIQELITDLRIRDNLTVGLQKAKDAVGGFGNAASVEAAKASNAFASAGDKIRSQFAGISADIKKGIGLGLGLGGTQLVARGVSELTGFLKESVGAAAEEEAQIRQLTLALEVNAAAWDGDIAAVEATIEARQQLAFADDELRASLQALTGATGDVDEAFRLQALAMDLARFKGVSLEQATSELVKVQAGSFRALKSLGIELDKNATSTEALAAIQKVVAGQAEEFGNTGAAAMIRFNIAVNNLKEDIGTGLTPALELLSGQLDTSLRQQGDKIAADAATFVRTATIEQIKAAREGVAEQFAKTQGIFSTTAAAGPDIKRVLDILDAGLAKTAEGMEETGRASLQFTAALDDLATGLVAAGNASPEMIRVAKATIEASEAHAALAIATAAATEAGSDSIAAVNALAVAQTADVVATKALKAATDALTDSTSSGLPTIKEWGSRIEDNTGLVEFFTTKVYDAAKALSFFDQTQAGTFSTMKIPGLDANGLTGVKKGEGTSLADSFLSDLDQDQRNRDEAARRERERQDELDRRRSEGLAKAKADAAAYASTLDDKLNKALRNSKDLVTTLFDKQHEKALRAITDVEKLASKQHDAALQQISDTLKLRLEQNAAPVTAAEEAQRRIEIARQRRDLNEGLAAAQASGDPEAVRNAQEALQSFTANQRIANLRLEQAKLDAAAQEAARVAQKAADDQLAAAKLQAAKDITFENDRSKRQRAQFDKELEALKRRDAGASPAKVAKDVKALEEKHGIITDERGFHHIGDVLAAAIEAVKIEPRIVLNPTFNLTIAAAKAETKAAPPVVVNVPDTSPPQVAKEDLSPITSKLDDVIAAVKAVRLEPILPAASIVVNVQDLPEDFAPVTGKLDELIAAVKDVRLEPIVPPPPINVKIVESEKAEASPPLLVSLSAPSRQDFSPVTAKLDDVIAAIKDIDLGPIVLPEVKAPPDQALVKEPLSAPIVTVDVAATLKLRALADAETDVGAASLTAVDGLAALLKGLDPFASLRTPVVPPVPIPPVPIEAPSLLLAAKVEVAKDDLSPMITAVGDAAALAAPKLAAFAESLGPLTLLKPWEATQETPSQLPIGRQPTTQDVLETAIKRIAFEPTIMVQSTVNVYVPPITLNGRLIAAALASSQSPAATPGIRTGSVSPRP